MQHNLMMVACKLSVNVPNDFQGEMNRQCIMNWNCGMTIEFLCTVNDTSVVVAAVVPSTPLCETSEESPLC